jgi:hypothetical protein
MLLYGKCYEHVYTYRRTKMDSVYAFKSKRFRNTRHSNIWNTTVMLFLKHYVYLH